MGFWSTLKTFSKNTLKRLGEHALAIPKTMDLFIRHKPARDLLLATGYTLLHDSLLIASVMYANQELQRIARDQFIDDEEEAYLSSSIMLSLMLHTVDAGVYNFAFKRGLQGLIRRSMLLVMAPSALTSAHDIEQTSVCSEKRCNWKREFKGNMRSTVTYYGNRVLLFGIGRIPVVGTALSTALEIPVNGNYISRAALPSRCDRHIYLENESMIAIGLAHMLSVMIFWGLCFLSIGTPSAASFAAFSDLMLLLMMANARQVQLPMVEPKDQLLPFEPISAWEGVVGEAFDWFVAGAKKELPKKIGKAQSSITPAQIQQWMSYITSARLYQWVTPPMLHSGIAFIRDPVMAPRWPEIRDAIVSGTTYIVNMMDWYKALKADKLTQFEQVRLVIAMPMKQLTGLPVKLSSFLLLIFPDNTLRVFILETGQLLSGMHIDDASVDNLQATPYAIQAAGTQEEPRRLPSPPADVRDRLFSKDDNNAELRRRFSTKKTGDDLGKRFGHGIQ